MDLSYRQIISVRRYAVPWSRCLFVFTLLSISNKFPCSLLYRFVHARRQPQSRLAKTSSAVPLNERRQAKQIHFDRCQFSLVNLAGREGFEPSIPDPKSGALPLGDRPSPNFTARSSYGRAEYRLSRHRPLLRSRLRRAPCDIPR